MPFDASILIDYILFFSCLFLLFGSIVLSFKMRFIQLRLFSVLFKALKDSFFKQNDQQNNYQILPHKALFTAMSTTLGIGTIVAPIIAIRLGGPGALLGFLLTAFFGSAATYMEVALCIEHRHKKSSGEIEGGPMQYLKHLLSPAAAKWYALSCLLLMMAWSGAQANQIAAILDSPFLGDYRVPSLLSGLFIAGCVLTILAGGIRRLGDLSSKLVPLMFLLYVGSSLIILALNIWKIPGTIQHIFSSALAPQAMANGALVGGIVSALRWGIFKGTQATEAGVGTRNDPPFDG